MPEWQCWCDQDWYASVLTDCRMASSDLETPFRCPTDVYLHSAKLDETLVHFRPASFLASPRVSPQPSKYTTDDVMHRNAADCGPSTLEEYAHATYRMRQSNKGLSHWCCSVCSLPILQGA